MRPYKSVAVQLNCTGPVMLISSVFGLLFRTLVGSSWLACYRPYLFCRQSNTPTNSEEHQNQRPWLSITGILFVRLCAQVFLDKLQDIDIVFCSNMSDNSVNRLPLYHAVVVAVSIKNLDIFKRPRISILPVKHIA